VRLPGDQNLVGADDVKILHRVRRFFTGCAKVMLVVRGAERRDIVMQ
jgi:hypothetical protein